jgi:hypothetical protein
MSLSLLWTVLGYACLLAAIAAVATVDVIELGEYSGRFIATLVALVGYYGAASLFNLHAADLHPGRARLLYYLVPAAGGLALLYCGYQIARNWHYEVRSFVRVVVKWLLIALLAAFGRFLLRL